MFTIYDSDYMDMNIGMAYRFLDKKTVLCDLHNHNYYEYFIITSGSVIHESNGKKMTLNVGDMVFIRPSDSHKYTFADDEDFKVINVSFTKKRFEDIANYLNDNDSINNLLNADSSPIITLPSSQLSSIKKKHYLLNAYQDEYKIVTLLKSLLIDAVTYFLTEFDSSNTEDSQRWLNTVLTKMNTPENIEEGLPALLRITNFSHGHLCRIFKNTLNMTPTQYITNLRLQYASNLLINSDYDILSISLRVGFSSLSHFIMIFKQKYGMSPHKYRSSYSTVHKWK